MAGLFSPQTLEQIRAASDIVEIIGAYVPLKRAGANFVARCPFHQEKTPSFNVNPHRQIFHCFGCHKGGDVFAFLREYENITFPEAVRRLAERAKIPLAYDTHPDQAESRQIKERLRQLHEQITQRWQNVLAREAAGQPARDYLAQRGVPEEAIQQFRLGAAPAAWDDTVNWARGKGFEPALVEQAGLIVRREGTDHYYDRFRDRLIFPICDETGRVIAFSGRILSPDAKAAKYVNSPETPIFTKSKVFYGLDKSKRAILDAGFAVVCEGQLDLIACYLAGVRNVVAPQGTAFTAEHARILHRYVDEVVLCFDADDAGQDAAVRSLQPLLASGLAMRVAVMPAPHDPDSYIRAHGGAAFARLIQEAADFFDYYLQRLCRQHNPATDRGRLAILRAMAAALHQTGNAVLVDSHAQKTALRLAVNPDAVRAEFRKLARPPTAGPAAPGPGADPAAVPAGPVPPSPQEFWLLKLLLRHAAAAAWLRKHLRLKWLGHDTVRAVIAARLALPDDAPGDCVPGLLAQFEDAQAQSLITAAATDPRPLPHPEQQLRDVVHHLRNQHLDRKMTACAHQAARPETPEAKQIVLLQRQQTLRKHKRRDFPLPEGWPD